MPWIKLPDGTVAHIRMAKRPRHRCCLSGCQFLATLQCDYQLAHGKTCDAYICTGHALEVGPDVHHCPTHARVQAGLFTGMGVNDGR